MRDPFPERRIRPDYKTALSAGCIVSVSGTLAAIRRNLTRTRQAGVQGISGWDSIRTNCRAGTLSNVAIEGVDNIGHMLVWVTKTERLENRVGAAGLKEGGEYLFSAALWPRKEKNALQFFAREFKPGTNLRGAFAGASVRAP